MQFVTAWRTVPFALLALTLAACSSTGASVTVDDAGYKALGTGDYTTSQNEFQPKQAQNPHDPYLELDLAVAYQQLGRLDLAESLNRGAMVDGKDVKPEYTTFPRDAGKTIAEIACENIGIAHHTEGCEPVAVNPPVQPPAVKNYVVFFDFNKASVTPESQKIVDEAVKEAKDAGIGKIQITGYTDTVGSDSYNNALSVKRADAVRSALLNAGLSGANIATDGKGFHDLLIPTGPGVREPQNRRAVIDLGGTETVTAR